jgi:tRNA-dihydrouridine synthase
MLKRAVSCDAVMVGRAAVRQPWIFSQARALSPGGRSVPTGELCPHGQALSPRASSVPTGELCPHGQALSPDGSSVPNLENTGLRFLELLSRYQPPEFHISRAMRFFGYFCDNLEWGNFLKNQLNREKTLAGIEKVWRSYPIQLGKEFADES